MRWLVGLLLVGAAVLKAVQLCTEPTVALIGPLGSWFLPFQIGVELGLGLVVLSGLYWRQVRWIVVLLFAGFAGYTLILVFHGAASCGCFGPLTIHPWWTFALDVFVLAGLLFSILYWGTKERATDPTTRPTFDGRPAVSAAVLGASGLCVVLLVRFADTQIASADGPLALAGDVVILEPETWIGRPLPIADWINLDLSTGEWIVLLHRHDCPACQEALPRYEELASQATPERVAIVEVPPYGESTRRSDGIHARLSDERKWFVKTPVEIRLLDGVVSSASSELH